MVKDVQAEIEKREKEYSMTAITSMRHAYRNKLQEYQQKEKSGTMTQADYEKAQMDLKQLEDRLKEQKTGTGSAIPGFCNAQPAEPVKNQLKILLTEYNKTKQYSYIVSYEQGLFYYKDTLTILPRM